MSEKSVREMNRLERRQHSLSARVFQATLKGALFLGFVAMLIGLGLYTSALVRQYTGDAYDLSNSCARIMQKADGADRLAEDVLRLYRGMSEEERATQGSEAYYERFREVENTETYRFVHSLLSDFLISGNVDDIYLAMYTNDPPRLVTITDPATEPGMVRRMGDWEDVEAREAETFLTLRRSRQGLLYDLSRTKEYGWMCTAGVPIYNEDQEIAGFVLSDVTLSQVGRGMKNFLLQYVIAMLILSNLIGFLMTRRMEKTLVRPINDIARASKEYITDKQTGAQETDHFARLNIHTGDEVENLSLIMADMEQELADYEKNLTQVVMEKERIGTELKLATRIQADTLPSEFPAFPDRHDFDIYAEMTPAKEVGGDFYDFFLIDDGHLGLVMADVSGKGVPAALFMMISKILVQNYAMTGYSPAAVLEAVNAQICVNNREEMFVTIWFGILDLRSGLLTAANAGHEYPFVKKANGRFEIVKDRHGFVIGGMEDIRYYEYDLQLEPGSKLFLYTDGVTEATNEANELFGMERLTETLNEAGDEKPEKILESVHEAVNLFVGNAPKFDDLTMLCVEYIGKREEVESTVKTLNTEAVVNNIPMVTDFVDAVLDDADCPIKTKLQIDVAIDELFTNIAQYAYEPGVGNATVTVEIREAPKTVYITFVDSGMPFDPTAKEDPDVSLSAEDREIGGLGIYMVKKSMDGMHYERRDGKNVLQIWKTL